MQKISGQGTVFVHASGTLKEVILAPDDQLKIDSGCLVGMSSTVRYDIKYTGKLKTGILGGRRMVFTPLFQARETMIRLIPLIG